MSNLIGPGSIAQGGATSVIFSTSPLPHNFGDKSRDAEGNEYVFCGFTGTVYYGCLVQITSTHRASALLGTANRPFRVGVVCGGTPSTASGQHPVSGDAGWVQVYGVHPAVQTGDTSDGTVSDTAGAAYMCIPQTSVGTPSGTLSLLVQATAVSAANTSVTGNEIFGMWLVDFAEVTDLTTWDGASGSSGPTSKNIKDATSGAATSAFIGQTLAVFMNYPYVTGVSRPFVNGVSDS